MILMSIVSFIGVALILVIVIWIVYRILRPRENMLNKEEGASDFEDESSWERF